VARFKEQPLDTPERLARYSPDEWGPGDVGIRAWKSAALAWLAADRSRRLEVGDTRDMLREAIRLMGGLQ
jgi:hypothetical protein